MATRGGSEMLVHHVQRLLEENPEFGVLKTDISNAFNCVSRKHLLQEVAAHFSELYGHVKQMYGQSSPLLYFNGHSTCIIESQEGVQQGDPLGPALFSLAIHPIICKAQEKSTTTTVLAYLDDIFVVGPSDQAEDLLVEMKSDLARINFNICDRKCEYYLPPNVNGNISSVRVTSFGVDILGVPVGCDCYVKSRCSEIASCGEELCSKLGNLSDAQGAMLLLRLCHIPRMNYLARCITPSLMEDASQIHDLLSRNTFSEILALKGIDDSVWQQACLKIKLGGFGISLLSQISPAAFVAAWSHSIVEIPKRFPCHLESFDKLTREDCPESQIFQHLHEAFESLPAVTTDGDLQVSRTFSDLLTDPSKLQHRLSSDIAEMKAAECLVQASSDHDAARLRSCQGRGAGAWLQAIPSTENYRLKSPEFKIASYLRLGVPLPFSDCVRNCDCGVILDVFGYHFIDL